MKIRPKFKSLIYLTVSLILAQSCNKVNSNQDSQTKSPVDYVNPYIGSISHLLVPCYPTVQLPNSLMRIYPLRADFTTDFLNGLPLIVTMHRAPSLLTLSPFQGEEKDLNAVMRYSYDQEKITPYSYQVYLDEQQTQVTYAPSHQSAIYQIDFSQDKPAYLVLSATKGMMKVQGNTISGYQDLGNNIKVYLYAESDIKPQGSGLLKGTESNTSVFLYYKQTPRVKLRYGVSLISIDQAKKNLARELKDYDVKKLAKVGREVWNEALGKIKVSGSDESDKTLFYTSLYRVFERPICISEDNNYFSANDGKVHQDTTPFYTDDWSWDTYRAAHPLRILIDAAQENNILNSFVRMSQQDSRGYMVNFPQIDGDARCMNSNHATAMFADAYAKGLRGFDLQAAYIACKKSIEEKTLIPWTSDPAGELDDFYKKEGYIPALNFGEKETVKNVNRGEKRQTVPVTLGTAYDEFCLSQMAKFLGNKVDAEYFFKNSYNYRKLFNAETGFFHPKDKEGKFIEPFDYRFSGGQGARDYYDENNGWTYRWDVQHNIADLVQLMGGSEQFCKNLDATFREPMGASKYDFYHQLPDNTAMVGQFSMANEPSLHIPYLYNYAGQPWKTQKRIHSLIKQWFRNDLMGIPGDEDGGGMTSFVVFSMMGFYPVTPGIPIYNIGSPMFSKISVTLSNGKLFELVANHYSSENKYIQSATLNGVDWNKPWFSQSDIENGGKLILEMGNKANRQWASDLSEVPPSAEQYK